MNLRQRCAVGSLLVGVAACYFIDMPSVGEDDQSDVRQVAAAFWKPPRDIPLFENVGDLSDQVRSFLEKQEAQRANASIGEMLYIDIYSQHPADYGAGCDVFDEQGKQVAGGSSMCSEPGGASLGSSISIG